MKIPTSETHLRIPKKTKMLSGKNVLLGVSGSIAAYKSALLCRALIKQGAKVKVLMTPSSTEFITPLTLSTLSKNPVHLEYSNPKTGEWNNHVELAKWADFFLLAPATQNTIAKMANGVCDNLLLATYFSMENKVYVAPAMDLDMFKHASNQANLNKLKNYGNVIIPAEKGELASGLVGEGRMAEVENILKAIDPNSGDLAGKKVLITAGPTYESIDPVRFIGNYSSGKMGYALAKEASSRGAEVTLISGPTSIEKPDVKEFVAVKSAAEMFDAVERNRKETELFIMAAAVADYTIENVANEKVKKKSSDLSLALSPTKDILNHVGQKKEDHQFVVGFALETNNEEVNAKAKLERKNCDMIVLNSLRNSGAGFGTDTNQISILHADNNQESFELKSKQKVAVDILNSIASKWLK